MDKNFTSVWENCLQVIKDNVSLQSYKTWFEPIVPVKLKDKVLTIQVPSQFFYEWLEEHYVSILKKTIKKELGNEGRLEYSIVIENNNKTNNPYTLKIPAGIFKVYGLLVLLLFSITILYSNLPSLPSSFFMVFFKMDT